MDGDEDEEGADDIEHEFKIDNDGQNKNKHLAEAMLHGKMSYGRGPEDDENTQYPPVISGGHSRPVSKNGKRYILCPKKMNSQRHVYVSRFMRFQISPHSVVWSPLGLLGSKYSVS